MCTIVIAGGPNKELSALRSEFQHANRIICADSGADALYAYQIVPDMVWGDMDSIAPETATWLQAQHVPTRLFPVDKDMTDTELCLTSIPKDEPILLITSLTGRPDHVMTNLLLAMRYEEEGYSLRVTDGITWVFPVVGNQKWRVPENLLDSHLTYSLIPLGQGVTGVSTVGMKYPLQDQDLVCGSSWTVSNELDPEKEEHGFDMLAGTMLIMITPKV
ncbi:MAG: thiamine diphosphokinase [Clostridiales bacterium]|nr:thiamine diphosphokinase [Candidatus Scatonaster coprocaballi]